MEAFATYLPEIQVRIDLNRTRPEHNVEIETQYGEMAEIRPTFLWVTYCHDTEGWHLADLSIFGRIIGGHGRQLEEIVNSIQYTPAGISRFPEWLTQLLDRHTPSKLFPHASVTPIAGPVEVR